MVILSPRVEYVVPGNDLCVNLGRKISRDSEVVSHSLQVTLVSLYAYLDVDPPLSDDQPIRNHEFSPIASGRCII